MKLFFRTGIIGMIAALFLCAVTTSAEEVPVKFTSFSVYVLSATAEDPLTDLEWRLGLSSVGNENAINGELMLATDDHGFSHETYFVLEDPFTFEPMVFPVILDIPPVEDANGNGIDDFYDRDAQVDSITTVGFHPNAEGGAEEFTAVWIRGAGETIGEVQFSLPYFGMEFGHQFQLVHYEGVYTFDRNGSGLDGTLALTNVLNLEDRISGPMTVDVVTTNALRFGAQMWDNGGELNYVVATNLYDGRFSTNFFSFWLLEDGVPANGVTDFTDWFMVLSSGDANGNGVLDLVETDGTQEQRPGLAIRKTDSGFEVTVTGTAGKTYRLEYTNNVTNTTWPDYHVVTMIDATQTVTLPAAASGHSFFRLREVQP